MKSLLKNLIWFPGILALILSASAVSAERPGNRSRDPEAMRARMEARMKFVQEQLNLSEAQQALLEAHRNRHRTAAREFHNSMRAVREDLKAELEKLELDMEKIYQLNSELKEIHGEMADHRLAGILEVREILTAEQFADFMKLTAKHRRGMGMGRGRHGPPGE
jgi:Spy/CpxP family protein refolding chaperone